MVCNWRVEAICMLNNWSLLQVLGGNGGGSVKSITFASFIGLHVKIFPRKITMWECECGDLDVGARALEHMDDEAHEEGVGRNCCEGRLIFIR